MTGITQTVSIVVPLLGLIFAAYSAYTIFNNRQKDRQVARSANISASFIKLGLNNTILKIYNQGKALAKNVNIQFHEFNGNLGIAELNEKLPINLAEYQHVDFPVSRPINSPSKITVVLTWEDSRGNQTKKMELTL